MTNGRVFLERVLEQPSDTELATLVETLVSQRVPEDDWLDYKDGQLTQNLDTAELRRDITAFGNSDGGCLVIGVTETDKRPTGFATCCGDVARAIKQIDGVLISVSGLLFPPPRAVRYITLPSGDQILVVAAPRSGRLAPVTERGRGVYYLRVADGRQAAPEYLLADLFFGRRQQAALAVRIGSCSVREFELEVQDVSIALLLENRGPHYARRIYGGALFSCRKNFGPDPLDVMHPLYSKVAWSLPKHLQPCHRAFDSIFMGDHESMRPLTVENIAFSARLPMIGHDTVKWRSAVYIGTDSGPTQWWQVEAQLEPYAGGIHVTAEEVHDRLPTVDGPA